MPSHTDLGGQRVLVTGASRRIGREVAHRLAELGAAWPSPGDEAG